MAELRASRVYSILDSTTEINNTEFQPSMGVLMIIGTLERTLV